jgi:predicted AlkP superfamily pyrophosphatase or phosphodiesterase
MKKINLLLCLLVWLKISAQDRPKLVVGIVVDQMKMEYLYRFSDDFSQNGFKKIMTQGYTFHNMHFNYVPTYTAPGHASIYTGATPAVHGILGNDWYDKTANKYVYCTDDNSVTTTGNGTATEGTMSPKKMLTTTITDELKMATNFQGKTISLSIKDRGAILPGGHFADWAFWLSDTGSFISSSFYGKQLPEWLNHFNEARNDIKYLEKGWNLLKPKATYNESLADENLYETPKNNTEKAIFPYDLKKIYASKPTDGIRNSPFGNNILADLALASIQNESLGKDDVTDFLAISFSSTDYVGHLYGPRSMEIQDTYLRLDETIAQLIATLDKEVGKSNYLLFLTADHAGAENPTYLNDHKYGVKNYSGKDVKKILTDFSEQYFQKNLVLNYSNFNLFFNHKLIQESNLDFEMVADTFKNFLLAQEQVSRVFTAKEIANHTSNDYYLNCIANGFDPKTSGDLVVLDKPAYMQYGATGTTHGTANSYDTHVPLLFYGWHIPKGSFYEKRYITQIAPTLSQLLKIPFTNGTQAEVLETVLNQE